MKQNKIVLFLLFFSFYSELVCSLFGHHPLTMSTSRFLEVNQWKKKGEGQWDPLVIVYGKKANQGWGRKGAVSLARLWFGASFFAPKDAFSPNTNTNTLPLSASLIAPRISVKENGVIAAFQYTYTVDEQWQVGARVQLPIIRRELKKIAPALPGKSLFGGPVVADFYQKGTDTVDGTSGLVNDFAIRLDFASLLPATTTGAGTKVRFINYHNPTTDTITVGGIDVTDKQTTVTDRHPLTTVHVPVGQLPKPPFGVLLDPAVSPVPGTVTTLSSLAGNGSTTDERNKFDQLFDYTPLSENSETQSALWLVPSVLATNPVQLTIPAKVIGNILTSLIEQVDRSPEEIFEKQGIFFTDKKMSGLGDCHATFFTNYKINETDYVQFLCGMSLPTGKKIASDEQSMFAFPLGSSGHTAFTAGAAGRWAPCQWFELVSMGWIEATLNNSVFVPVFYQGAKIRQCNNYVRAWTSWTTVGGRVDAYIHFPTHYAHEGYTTLVFGYELYYKGKDRLTFVYPQAVDVTGVLQSVDSKGAAAESNRRAHTISIDLAYTHSEQVTLSAGWNYVMAGLHVARAMGWQCGIQASF